YQEVEKDAKTDFYSYALFMEGWCYINLGHFQDAVERFNATVDSSRRAAADGGRVNPSFEKEALKDLVLAYAKLPTADYAKKARGYFQKVGGEKGFKEMMAELADFYYG